MKHLPATAIPVLAACLLSAVSNPRDAEAQFTVQQPVVHSIGGQFGVMVPDRGGIFLGGIGRAGSSRSSYGFGPFRGSSYGSYTEHIGISSHVFIMDLNAMDRQILDMADSGSCDSSFRHSGIAFTEFQRSGPAFRVETPARRYFGLRDNGRISSGFRAPISPVAPPPPQTSTTSGSSGSSSTKRRSRALDPDHSWDLGQEAEEDGNMIVAKLHYQAAAQYGSQQARQRLVELGEKPVAAK